LIRAAGSGGQIRATALIVINRWGDLKTMRSVHVEMFDKTHCHSSSEQVLSLSLASLPSESTSHIIAHLTVRNFYDPGEVLLFQGSTKTANSYKDKDGIRFGCLQACGLNARGNATRVL
jgi:hypothetical protein